MARVRHFIFNAIFNAIRNYLKVENYKNISNKTFAYSFLFFSGDSIYFYIVDSWSQLKYISVG